MFATYVIGLGAILTVALFWVGVQIAWRRVFPATSAESDVLAERMGCGGGCGCTLVCRKEVAEEGLQ